MMTSRIDTNRECQATCLGLRRAVETVLIRLQLQLVGHLADVYWLICLHRHTSTRHARSVSLARWDTCDACSLLSTHDCMGSPARYRCRQGRDPGTGASPLCAELPDRPRLYGSSYTQVVGCTLAKRKLAVHRQQTAAGRPGDTAQPAALLHMKFLLASSGEPEHDYPSRADDRKGI